jgi:hypothetical protein
LKNDQRVIKRDSLDMLYTNTNENLKITSMNLQKGRTKKVEK